MYKFLIRLNKAEYLFRPSKLFHRFFSRTFQESDLVVVSLPWGEKIEVSPEEDIGKAIIRLGLYDLTVSEVIFRICRQKTNESKIVLDVGGNIGYMTSVFSHALSSVDQIHTFEPHPSIYEKLLRNIKLMKGPRIYAHEMALSDQNGEMRFMLPKGFEQNRGLGFLESSSTQLKMECAQFLKNVQTHKLDDFSYTNKIEEIFLMKVDTEGNELSVFHGARDLLKSKKIRTIIYEDHVLYPNPVSQFLEGFGYQIFFLKRGLFGVKLKEGRESTPETWEPNSFLATLDPEGVKSAVKSLGWQILR